MDLLKFIFAVIIVFFHGCKNLPGMPPYFINGRLAVEFFFIVSGCLMAASAKRYTADEETSVWRQTGSFIGHKIARLSPDVFIAWFIAFYVMVIIPGKDGLVHRFLSGVFEFFFLRLAGFTGQTQVNGAVWYISAMLLAMAVLFPLLVRKRDLFMNWLAPLAAIFLYGYIAVRFEGFPGSTDWGGFATKGMIRALAGLCLGAVCYSIAQKLASWKLRLFGKLCVSIAAFLSFAYVIYILFGRKHSMFDFVLVVMLALGITLVFSGSGIDILGHMPSAVNRFVSFLGDFSMDLFLSHSYWSRQLDRVLPQYSGKSLLLAYLIVVLINALLLMIVSKLLRKAWPGIKKGLKNIFLQKEQ